VDNDQISEEPDHFLRKRVKALEAALLDQRQCLLQTQRLPNAPTVSSSGTSDLDAFNANVIDDSHSAGSSMSSILPRETELSGLDIDFNTTWSATHEVNGQSPLQTTQNPMYGISTCPDPSTLLFGSSKRVTAHDLL